ncbi:hypothetical protein RJ641_012683, partial [Dillenia turbinata]
MAAHSAKSAAKILRGCIKSSSPSLSFLPSSTPSSFSKFRGFSSVKPSSATSRFLSKSRLPLELGAVQSMMPLHSVTASALFTSLLSLKAQSWGYLAEGWNLVKWHEVIEEK